jgi:hypothetical protein
MQRRKYLAALGSLAAGGAAIGGTGAFTSVQAQRTVETAVVGDSNAYLALEPIDSRASLDGEGQLEINFDESNNGALGLNRDARTAFTDLFRIRNQGDDPAYVGVGLSMSDVYIDGSSQGNAQPHLFDYNELSGFVYDEDVGPGLSFNGGNGNMGIDSGGRVDVRFDSNGSPDPSTNPRILSPGEDFTVDLSIITTDNTQLTGNGGNRITIAAAEPGSDRDFTDNPNDYGN